MFPHFANHARMLESSSSYFSDNLRSSEADLSVWQADCTQLVREATASL